MDVVKAFLDAQYEHNEDVRRALYSLYTEYISWGIHDSNFAEKFSKGSPEHFHGCLWEMQLAKHFKGLGLALSSADDGPDFCIQDSNGPIWVEAVAPSPRGIPEDWLESSPPEEIKVSDVPHEEILLRWTSAVKSKMEQHSGGIRLIKGEKTWVPGWVEKGKVGEREPYVIAVTSCQLGLGQLLNHEGISTWPYAVEMTLAVGPIVITIDRESGKQTGSHHSYRPVIKNPNGADVPTDIFLRPEYESVSAILASPAGVNAACGQNAPLVLVHNPNAKNPLVGGILGADEEYEASIGMDIQVTRSRPDQVVDGVVKDG